jgi:formylglycine-generating enzyme required for sulfatase activity
VDAGACSAPGAAAATCNWGRRPDHPVNCVDALQAAAFCAWLGGRLPTAAEWEHAAKGSQDPIHPWGDAPVTGARGNLCDRRCPEALTAAQRQEWESHRWVVTREDDGWPGTSPVGAYPQGATAWGLLDMVGNVWQWTSTWFNPTELEIRGGSWLDGPEFLRNSERLKHVPRTRHIDIGFRCVWPGAPLGPLRE